MPSGRGLALCVSNDNQRKGAALKSRSWSPRSSSQAARRHAPSQVRAATASPPAELCTRCGCGLQVEGVTLRLRLLRHLSQGASGASGHVSRPGVLVLTLIDAPVATER